jgi:hypothetical protein
MQGECRAGSAIGSELSSRRTDSRGNGTPSVARPSSNRDAAEVVSSGEVGEVFIEDAKGARAYGASCGGAEGAQAGGAGGVGGAVKEVGGGGGVAAGVGEIAPMQLSHGEIRKHHDTGTASGGRELVERGGECGPGCGVVTGLEVSVAGRGSQLSGAVSASKTGCLSG